ncbi:(2Fe-2S) ferredoxin domain-containing protein [Streptomyces sp. NPDC093594]|uniref:(2Fe-2S) ferredoxin domain-containing protein n=1 Tax=Streptomyces sp. NPDC093594 TaxID=3155305 RepID=UPI00344E5E23
MTVCRGCCRGTAKVPGTDHAAEVAVLKAGLGAIAQVRAVNCLGACEQADVVVVQSSSPGRAAGGWPVRLGLVNDPGARGDIVVWVRVGGPGLADPPDSACASSAVRCVRRTVEN